MTSEHPAAETTDHAAHIHADADMRVDHGGPTREQVIRVNALNAALSLKNPLLEESVGDLLATADRIAIWISDGTAPATSQQGA